MVSESLTKMLILQDRDMKLRQVEADLENLPLEKKAARDKIASLDAELEAARQRIRSLESRGGLIETEMKSIEAQVVKYKNQQLEVKKNEEYQALTHEIDLASRKVSDLESQELEVLYELDEARKALGVEEKAIRERRETEERHLAALDEKETRVKGELDGARSAFEAAEAELDRPARSKYLQVARGLKLPVVVELSRHKCHGCHMRVSNAIDSEVRTDDEITTCDNCGRILYCAS